MPWKKFKIQPFSQNLFFNKLSRQKANWGISYSFGRKGKYLWWKFRWEIRENLENLNVIMQCLFVRFFSIIFYSMKSFYSLFWIVIILTIINSSFGPEMLFSSSTESTQTTATTTPMISHNWSIRDQNNKGTSHSRRSKVRNSKEK